MNRLMSKVEELYYPSLYETAVALTSTHSSKEILHNVVERVAKTIGAKCCSLIMISSDKKRLFHVASYGLSERHVVKGPILADKSISEAMEGKTVAILKASDDSRIRYRNEAELEEIASILSVPMKLKDKVVGVLRIYTAEPYEFTDDDIYFAKAAASLAAIGLKNAKYYKSIKENSQKVKKELLEITNLLNS
ncbi:MAG: GAF domain-containing protein [Dehalococcoidales bacterium]|nr:GAF domain-containing protein [Dehalococcoidales bacterium]